MNSAERDLYKERGVMPSKQSPPARPLALQRIIQRLAATRPIAWLLAITLHRLDRSVLRLTGGRTTATELLAGVPVLTVEAIGAHSGAPRPVPLLAIPRGEDYLLIATSFGKPRHPAWYFNVRAHPDVNVRFRDARGPFKAREAEGEEWETCWQLAVATYPGYGSYLKRAAGRHIPILILSPVLRGPSAPNEPAPAPPGHPARQS